jgi:hypothetical protein
MTDDRREQHRRSSPTTGVVIIVIVGVASVLLCLCTGFSLFFAGA